MIQRNQPFDIIICNTGYLIFIINGKQCYLYISCCGFIDIECDDASAARLSLTLRGNSHTNFTSTMSQLIPLKRVIHQFFLECDKIIDKRFIFLCQSFELPSELIREKDFHIHCTFSAWSSAIKSSADWSFRPSRWAQCTSSKARVNESFTSFCWVSALWLSVAFDFSTTVVATPRINSMALRMACVVTPSFSVTRICVISLLFLFAAKIERTFDLTKMNED